MSLQVWLPLNGDLHNQGLSNVTVTNNGATIDNAGKIGKCYSFNGSNQYINTGYGNGKDSKNISVALWIKPLASLNDKMVIGVLNGSNQRLYIGVKNNTYNISYGSYTWGRASNAPATTNIWSHLVLTVDNNGKVLLYQNGILTNETTTYTTAFSFASNFFIGGRSDGYYANCQINDVRIYDHALSPKEVEEIAKGLVLHYPLNNYWLAENILTNSSGYQGTSAWSGLVTASNENGHAYLIAKRTDTTSTSRTFCTHTAITSLVSSWSPGDKFTISGWYKVPSSEIQETGGNMFIRWAQSSSSNSDTDTGFTTSTATKDVWIRFENTYTVPPNFASGKAANFYLSAFAAQKRATVYWKDVKLEKGDKATPWCPAKTDTLYTAFGYNGTTIYDSSGYANNGTIVGTLTAAASSPRYSVAISKPNGAYIRIDNRPNTIGAKDAITVSMWVNFSTWGNCISCTEGGGWNFEEAGGGLRFPIYIASVGYKVAQSTITSASLKNAWHMLTGTMDSNNVKFYVDGEEAGTIATGSTNGIGYANNYIFIGGEAGGNSTSPASSAFVGAMSDARIYATALTADQIKELYTTSMSIDSSGNVYARELVEL